MWCDGFIEKLLPENNDQLWSKHQKRLNTFGSKNKILIKEDKHVIDLEAPEF